MKFATIAAAVVLAAPVFANTVETAEAQAPGGTLEIRKVDAATGELLPGGHFNGQTCTRFPGTMGWTCQSLNDYSWFDGGLNTAGTTGSGYDDNVDQRGGWGPAVWHCIVINETSAPEGYVASTTPVVACKGEGGWTVENAVAVGFVGPNGETPQAGDWTISNDPATMSSVLSLPNSPVAPEPTPTPTPTETVAEPEPTPTVTTIPETVEPTPTPSETVAEPTVTPTPTVTTIPETVQPSPSAEPTVTVTVTTAPATVQPSPSVEKTVANKLLRTSSDVRPLAATGANN